MNVKRTGLITLALAATAFTARHFYGVYRHNREFEAEWEALVSEEQALEQALFEAEIAEYTAHYDVGDPVLIRNPYVMDEPPAHGLITNIAYIQDVDTFTYEVSGQTGWLNENWLEYDDLGPMKLAVVPVAAPKQSDEVAINYCLDTMRESRIVGDAREYESAEAILRDLTKGADANG